MEQFHSSAYFLYVFPIFLGAILLEAWIYRRQYARAYPWKDSVTSLGVALGHQVTGVVNQLLIQGIMAVFVWQYRLFTVPDRSWWSYPLLFVALEFAYYWYHRCAHEVRLMWATHSTHHSPNEMALSAAYRLGWTPFWSMSWVFFLPLVWLGFNPAAVFGMLAISLVYQFWLHTRLIPPLGWLEGILNTPSAHRVHHASNPEYLDKNYGGILMVFDRMFGTYIPEASELEIRYGLVHRIESQNPLVVVFREWINIAKDLRHAPGWSARWHYVMGRPGWGPDAPPPA